MSGFESAVPAKKESAPALSTLAARILSRPLKTEESGADDGAAGLLDAYNELLADAKALAGSVLSQDETKGQGK